MTTHTLQTFETPGPKSHPLRPKLATVVAVVLLILGGLYFSGRLDYALYPVGLNFHSCARNGFGATFCGSDLTAYEKRWNGVQQQLQQSQQQVQQDMRRAECQADPALSFCTQP